MTVDEPTPASHRTLALLALVVLASRGLSFSRGNLNDVGAICFAFVLFGLVPLLFFGRRWHTSSNTEGGFPTWRVALPCAFVYVFATNGGRYLLVFSDEWRLTLIKITWIALALALPTLALTWQPLRQRLVGPWPLVLVSVPLIPALIVFGLVTTASPDPIIDVFLFETQAARSLLFGINPYDITFTNVYGGAELYPSGIPDSYPYPPLSLLFACLGYILGDVRWALIACHIATAVLLGLSARHRLLPATEAVMLATLFFWLPHGAFVSEQAWTDPSVTMGLGLMSLCLAHRRPAAALWAAGFTLALKQTMVVLLPALWGLWRRLGRSQLVAVFAISAGTGGLFLLWNPQELWKDIVLFHMLTPFRPGALTLSAYLVHFFQIGPLPSWMSAVGLIVGAAVTVVALRPHGDVESTVDPCDSRRVWTFFAGLAFALLLTLLLSKHAFMNYYYLVHFCLVAALVWSRIADQEAVAA